MQRIATLLLGLALIFASSVASSDNDRHKRKGLNQQAEQELVDAGVSKYVGLFEPAFSSDAGQGWTKHTYATDPFAGPICIAGTPYSVFTKVKNPKKLLIFMQGGGACWQDFSSCVSPQGFHGGEQTSMLGANEVLLEVLELQVELPGLEVLLEVLKNRLFPRRSPCRIGRKRISGNSTY